MSTYAGRRRAAAVAAALASALALLTAACDGRDHDTGRAPAPGAPGPGASPGHEEHDGHDGRDGRDGHDGDDGDDGYTGHITVRDLRPDGFGDGRSDVSCTAIDAEFRVEPYHARTRWKAVALDYDPGDRREYTAGNIARDVLIEPSSGTLELGRSVKVRVSGRYEGRVPDFWIVVQAPEPKWASRVTLPFRCR
ncbi:hypothetical protein [Streptomyces sp. TRM64462]|uniref:hypothetical protein n=1 Tax=Streptomyces sp. TRM64462 TaxID=2741726 RepID=UPI001586D910|nr:hypothetical protein [Streptomyces sp. TRM64462]